MKEKTKILIAESEQIIADDLQLMLENSGHTIVATVSTREEAIKKVKMLEPDIVIMNIYLSGKIEGKSTAKQIKKFSKTLIMFYSTCKDTQTINDIQALTDTPVINPNKLLFGLDLEK
ncbi:MAG: response regulator [Candidatus Cloacimonetes bacterium]|nr:response regulator [Candidatus Cloacimonadota bacterium]